MSVFSIILLVIQAIVSIAFIAIVMSQTTKSEGLTGTIGGQTSPNFKGKPGFEERIQQYTLWLAIVWFVVSILVAISLRGSSLH